MPICLKVGLAFITLVNINWNGEEKKFVGCQFQKMYGSGGLI